MWHEMSATPTFISFDFNKFNCFNYCVFKYMRHLNSVILRNCMKFCERKFDENELIDLYIPILSVAS